MRISTILFASILAVAAFAGCKSSNPAGDDTTDAAGSGSGSNNGAAFSIRSADIMLMPGEETTKCYYFHTPNTAALPINKWTSHMTPGSHHMIMFFSSGTSSKPDGTIDEDCGLGGSATNVPIWVYASQMPDQELDLPADDGGGKPLAQLVPPNTAAVFQMHYLNTTDAAMTVHVELNAFALDAAATYTPTAAYITYNDDITIPAGATGVTATGTCPAPTGVQFWTMSSHSHKQSVHTQINDGAAIADTGMVFQSSDWEHPGAKNWMASPFYTFASGKLTFQCTYDNNNMNDPNHLNTIVAGQSAQFNEMCMATGYIFPATTYKGCVCLHAGTGTQCYAM